jgi:hypothetical protein
MNWSIAKHHFNDHHALIDIYYEAMNDIAWLKLFSWLSENTNVSSINCYISSTDQNLDYFPEDIAKQINEKGFYCFASLLIDDITLFLRFYDKEELECDISPKEIDSEGKLRSLLNILDEIKEIIGVRKYILCPENYKEGTFNVNGVFCNQAKHITKNSS